MEKTIEIIIIETRPVFRYTTDSSFQMPSAVMSIKARLQALEESAASTSAKCQLKSFKLPLAVPGLRDRMQSLELTLASTEVNGRRKDFVMPSDALSVKDRLRAFNRCPDSPYVVGQRNEVPELSNSERHATEAKRLDGGDVTDRGPHSATKTFASDCAPLDGGEIVQRRHVIREKVPANEKNTTPSETNKPNLGLVMEMVDKFDERINSAANCSASTRVD